MFSPAKLPKKPPPETAKTPSKKQVKVNQQQLEAVAKLSFNSRDLGTTAEFVAEQARTLSSDKASAEEKERVIGHLETISKCLAGMARQHEEAVGVMNPARGTKYIVKNELQLKIHKEHLENEAKGIWQTNHKATVEAAFERVAANFQDEKIPGPPKPKSRPKPKPPAPTFLQADAPFQFPMPADGECYTVAEAIPMLMAIPVPQLRLQQWKYLVGKGLVPNLLDRQRRKLFQEAAKPGFDLTRTWFRKAARVPEPKQPPAPLPRTQTKLEADAPVQFPLPENRVQYTVGEVLPMLAAITDARKRNKQFNYIIEKGFVPELSRTTRFKLLAQSTKPGFDPNQPWIKQAGRPPIIPPAVPQPPSRKRKRKDTDKPPEPILQPPVEFPPPENGLVYTVAQAMPLLMAIKDNVLRNRQWRYLAGKGLVPDLGKTKRQKLFAEASKPNFDLSQPWFRRAGRPPVVSLDHLAEVVRTRYLGQGKTVDRHIIRDLIREIKKEEYAKNGQTPSEDLDAHDFIGEHTVSNYMSAIVGLQNVGNEVKVDTKTD